MSPACRRIIGELVPIVQELANIGENRECQHAVLANVRQSLSNNWNRLADDLRHAGDIPLSSFLTAADLEPEELYSNDSRTFTDCDTAPGSARTPCPTLSSPARFHVSRMSTRGASPQWRMAGRRPSPSTGPLESVNADDVLGPWLRETAGNRDVTSV